MVVNQTTIHQNSNVINFNQVYATVRTSKIRKNQHRVKSILNNSI